MKKLILMLLLVTSVQAQEPLQFDSDAQQAHFEQLTRELRCLVCQNQNLADSDAPLAHDLRKDILEMMKAGRSDDEIKQFLVERYGDFVLYRPPFKGDTLLLWLAPLILLLAGAALVIHNIRARGRLLSDQQDSST